ncbi:SDR family oxidoreductase [Candidatus Pelagibacter sp. HIMB1782]|uniref:SDR family oxidoreductase n=1 Tax=Candidatus Pelagibacter sp. HIMB1782 TaxID=3413375 RepID=UPI003F84879D
MRKNVCLITGGAGFLGRKYCEFFLKKGFMVLCVDKDKNKLIKTYTNKKNFKFFTCDITKEKSVLNLYNKINKNFFVNVLINNAAIDAVPFKKQNKIKFPKVQDWDKELDVSLKGSFLMIKYFGEEMIKKKEGSIINIGSDLSVIAPNQKLYKSSYKNYIKPVTYSVIKHGMLGLTKYFASLYAKDNVRVNMVSPGPIKNKQSSKFLKELTNVIPMERLSDPIEIIGLIYFLATKGSSYITGQNILIDGGRTII